MGPEKISLATMLASPPTLEQQGCFNEAPRVFEKFQQKYRAASEALKGICSGGNCNGWTQRSVKKSERGITFETISKRDEQTGLVVQIDKTQADSGVALYGLTVTDKSGDEVLELEPACGGGFKYYSGTNRPSPETLSTLKTLKQILIRHGVDVELYYRDGEEKRRVHP